MRGYIINSIIKLILIIFLRNISIDDNIVITSNSNSKGLLRKN